MKLFGQAIVYLTGMSYDWYEMGGVKMTDTRAWVPDEAIAELTTRRALQSEEDSIALATQIIKENVPIATMSMVHLAIHSPTESVRFNAAKYLMDRALGKVEDGMSEALKPAWELIYDKVIEEAEGYTRS